MQFTNLSREINMKRLKSLVIGILALSVAGCGQTVVETLNITEGPALNAPGSGKSIVILPFADYSQGDLQSAHRRNMVITETMTDSLIRNGFGLPIQEDVFEFLVDEKIIQVASYEQADTSSLQNELNDDWSDVMKQEITRYKDQVENDASKHSSISPGTHGLTSKKIGKIGRHFDADYIVRGRILEFKTRDEASWAPWKKGILPFVSGGANRILNGFASSDEYDETNEALTGALIGGIIGYNTATFPFSGGDELFGLSSSASNSITWSAAGYGIGKVGHRSGRVDQATVQLRVWIQEASTGNVVWSNRVRVLVSPESILADNQYDTLFNLAIEKGVTTLVDHFVTYGM
ncbi:MAG: gas vesicle protein [Desulforhopalus sp.]|jgi:gas vesicle protein